MNAPGRNDPCTCGSGRKFKKCCLASPPTRTDALMAMARQHLDAGRLREAAALYDQVLAAAPDHADALHLSGHVADRLGNTAVALARLQRAVALAPASAACHNSLGIALGQRTRHGEAIESFRRALALRPRYPQALNNLAVALRATGEFDEAESCYRQLLEIEPGAASVHSNYAALLQSQGRLAEAQGLFDRALELEPRSVAAHGNRILNLLYRPELPPGEVRKAASDFARAIEPALAGERRGHRHVPLADRRLKIGYVSADFRRHSVAYFIEPLLAHHDHQDFEIFCYATGPERDAVTERLEALADHWVVARALGDAALADRIRADGIDVLVDLSGHTAGNRLLVFARKPAPVQVTWMGFLATTGLESMDYRLTDEIADPPDADSHEHVERLLRLDRTCLAYLPPDAAPPVARLPALERGYVTFGSFNTPAKHNPEVLALWGEILRAVPDSRLLLKGRGLEKGRLRSATEDALARAGVAPERVVLQGYETDEAVHLRRYEAVDIGLDPFPHNGVTTTCAALWMGVPVLTWRGDRHSARMCASMLAGVGLDECVAASKAEYRELAVSLARNLGRLADLRQGLRARMRASPLLDAAGLARAMESAYRRAWHEWCATGGGAPGLPGDSR